MPSIVMRGSLEGKLLLAGYSASRKCGQWGRKISRDLRFMIWKCKPRSRRWQYVMRFATC